jgi:uncharacterized protein (TIGR02001 family)
VIGRAPQQLTALGFALAFAGPSLANGHFGGSLGVTSDYVSYGLSQTRSAAAVQGDAHYQQTLGEGDFGLFGGVFASSLNASRYAPANWELDPYLGGTWRIDEKSSATLVLTHYAYPGDSGRPSYDYDEISLTWGLANNRLFGTIAWSPDTETYTRVATARCCRKLAYEVAAHQPLGHQLNITVGAGYADLTRGAGYAYWNAGVSRALGDVELNLSYIGTQERAEYFFGETVGGSRWAASAIWRFGVR